MVLVLTKK